MSNLPYDAEIEYLESTGTQYIDTGISASYNIGASMSFRMTTTASGDYAILGIGDDRFRWGYSFYNSSTYGYNCLQISYLCNRATGGSTNTIFKNVITLKKHFIRFLYNYKNSKKSKFNHNSEEDLPEAHYSNLGNIWMFGWNYGGGSGAYEGKGTLWRGAKVKIYSCKITENSEIVRDFIPVRVGQVGYMYDKISGQLFGNLGSGDFVLGKDRHPITQQEFDPVSFRRKILMNSTTNYDTYLTCKAIDSCLFEIYPASSSIIGQILYLINDGLWKSVTSNGAYSFPSIEPGSIIKFKANATKLASSTVDDSDFTYFSCPNRFEVYGDPWSLYFGDNFLIPNEYDSTQNFKGLFQNCSGLVSAEHLQLKATTLLNATYASMFENCINLVKAPKIEALGVGDYSCYAMFFGCNSLTDVPDLDVYNLLGTSAFRAMFGGCTSLTKAPLLPAWIISPSSSQSSYVPTRKELYYRMFNGCTNLNYVKAMNTAFNNYDTSSNSGNTYLWLQGVASEGTFVANIKISTVSRGISGIPSSWEIIYFDCDQEKYYKDVYGSVECDEFGNII